MVMTLLRHRYQVYSFGNCAMILSAKTGLIVLESMRIRDAKLQEPKRLVAC
jgi:hypothetical protein